MLRAINSLCRLFNSEFPHRGSQTHVVFQGVSMPVCKLVMLGIVGVFCGVFVSAVAYWVAVRFT
jgi:hypothetical protein